jgi:hypothetical protein
MTHGIEFRRADGSVVLEQDETFAGVIATRTRNQGFSGTISVPNFDSDKGMFYVQFEVRGEGYGMPGQTESDRYPVYGAAILPDLSWNNSSKEMTVTPADVPPSWLRATKPNYTIVFIHYR